jgi:succinate dehydrogenase flavin-adding protein (antitoxin of CptAB toxin-antitoxin module)
VIAIRVNNFQKKGIMEIDLLFMNFIQRDQDPPQNKNT